MPYRLVKFNPQGKIVSVSPKSFKDTDAPIFTFVASNPKMFGFVDEALLPTGSDLGILEQGLDVNNSYAYDGGIVRIDTNLQRSYYDPRVETSVVVRDPFPYFQYGDPLVQDLTRTQVFFNDLNKETKPRHSTAQKKFGPSSGLFGGAIIGTGGGIYVTNINKRSFGASVAPHNILGGGSTASYSMEMFFRPSSTALSSNFTLMQKGPTGASANWKITFDNSSGFLQFAWQSYNSTGGYNYSENIINTAGISANTWHHVAVSVVRNTGVGASAGIYQIAGYWNGANVFSRGVTSSTFPEFRYDQGLYIGNNHLGTEGFDGYIDSIRVMESGTTSGVFGPSGYGFLPFGSGTLGVPTLQGFSLNSDTCFVMNFNNLQDSSDFYAESSDYITGVVSRITDLVLASGDIDRELETESGRSEIGLRDIFRYQRGISGPTGISDATGFSMGYGPITNPFVNIVPPGATGFTAHGYDYAFIPYSVKDEDFGFTGFRSSYKYNMLYEYCLERMAFIEGACGNRGSCGNIFKSRLGTNPFGRLFSGMSGNCYGVSANHTNLFIDPLDAETMNYIMSNGYLVSQGISFASYTFTDALDFERTLTATEINNLRLDILEYYNRLATIRRDIKNDIAAATTKGQVRDSKKNKGTGVATVPPLEAGGIEGLP